MCKKFLSLLLAVMLIVSVMTVGFVSVSAATTDGFTPDPNMLYFDTDGTGWEMGSKNKVAFHIFGGDLEKPLAWGASKCIGAATEGETGVFEIDPQNGKQGYTLTPGVQYKIIFVRTEGKNWTDQTYDLLFTTDCLGKVAYCDGSEYENPVDSSKKTLAAFWKDMDATVVGPVKQISSIGNVVGTCLEEGKTDEGLLNDFLTVVDSTTGKTKYENAMQFTVNSGTKTEQQMIDDIGAGLNLAKQDIQAAITDAGIESAWDYQASSLHEHTPGEPVHENEVPATYKAGGSYESVVYCSDPDCGKELSRETVNTDPVELDPTKLYFDTDGTGWEMGSKNKVAFHIFGGDLEKTLAWGSSKEIGAAAAGLAGVFEFDPTKNGQTFNPGVQYKVIFVRTEGKNWGDQTYDLLFTVDCFGHVAYSDGTMIENPVDSSKKTLAAYWHDMDATVVGPVKQISSIGNVVGTCLEEGTTDESLFNDFLTVVDDTTQTTKYQNAYHFVVEAGQKTEQQMIDDIGTGLSLTKQQVYDAIAASGVESAWDPEQSSLPGEVTPPHTHTPGEPVIENDHNSTCTVQGSYEEVIYCTGCGEELSRETKYHELADHTPGDPVNENITPATCGKAGKHDSIVYCTVCKEKLDDLCEYNVVDPATGNHTPGDPEFVNVTPATCGKDGKHDEIVKCTVCGNQLDDLCKYNVVDPATGNHTPGNPVHENENVTHDKTTFDVVTYCTECGNEISRVPGEYPIITHTLTPVAEVPATEDAAGTKAHYKCTVCNARFQDADGTIEATDEWLIIPKLDHVHTPGDPVQENVNPATCTAEGSYEEVVYCTSCGAELSRTPKTIDMLAHSMKYVPKRNATETADGWLGHFECKECGKYFADATGTTELTWDQIRIPMIVPEPTGKCGDVDGDGEITILDVTIIQRVLANKPISADISIEAVNKLGDVDNDGSLTTLDATHIQRWLLGLDQNLPIGKDVN